MNLLTLTYEELVKMLKAFFVSASFIAIVYFCIKHFGFNSDLPSTIWQSFTTGMSVATVAFGTLAKMTWKHPSLAKWLGRPVVHGLWYGQLHTNFSEKNDGTEMPSIEIAFVIRQTYVSLSVSSYTANQDGESHIEALLQSSKTRLTRLCYIFELKRQYQGENKLTTGAGELKLLEMGTLLRGHYWTNSPTQGDLELRFVTHDCKDVDSFNLAKKKYLERLENKNKRLA